MELKLSWNKQEFGFLFYDGPNRTIYLLNFSQKKTGKIPPREIDLAINRMKEIDFENTIPVSHRLH